MSKKKITKNVEVIRILEEFRDYYQEVSDARRSIYNKTLVAIEELEVELSIDNITILLSDIPEFIRNMISDYLDKQVIPNELIEIRIEYGELLNKRCRDTNKHFTQRDHIKLLYDQLISECHLDKLNYKMESHLLGSYRRGSQYCGDANILMVSDNDIMDDIILALSQHEKYEIVLCSATEIRVRQKYLNFIIKIRFCSYKDKGSFMINLTGSDTFNIRLRRIARKKNLELSEYGIYDPESQILHTYSNEEDLFKKLDLDYIEPENRN